MVELSIRVLAAARANAEYESYLILAEAHRRAQKLVSDARYETDEVLKWVRAASGPAVPELARSELARSGPVRSEPEPSGPARSGPARSEPAPSGPARSEPAPSGPAPSEPARSGYGEPGAPAPSAPLEGLATHEGLATQQESDDFWTQFDLPDEDRWAFLDEADPIGSGVMRRLFHRSTSREQPPELPSTKQKVAI